MVSGQKTRFGASLILLIQKPDRIRPPGQLQARHKLGSFRQQLALAPHLQPIRPQPDAFNGVARLQQNKARVAANFEPIALQVHEYQ